MSKKSKNKKIEIKHSIGLPDFDLLELKTAPDKWVAVDFTEIENRIKRQVFSDLYMNHPFDDPSLRQNLTMREMRENLRAYETYRISPLAIDTNMIDSMRYGTTSAIASRRHYSAFDKAIMQHKQYLWGNLPHADTNYDPEFLNAFIWGPQGEWIGKAFPKDVTGNVDSAWSLAGTRYYRVSRDLESRGIQLINLQNRLDPNITESSLYFLKYITYEALSAPVNEKDDRDERWPNPPLHRNEFDASILRLAGCIQLGLIDTCKLEEWANALRSGKFKFGYGALRDGDDRYDPFGVLAYVSNFSLTWDAREKIYRADDTRDPTRLSSKKIIEFLGWKGAGNTFNNFIDDIVEKSDQRSDFNYVVNIITGAKALVQDRKNDLRKLLERLPRIRYDENYLNSACFGTLTSSISARSHFLIDAQCEPDNWRFFRDKYAWKVPDEPY